MDKMKRYESDGISIIVPKNKEMIPMNCPCCGLAFSTREDVLSYKLNKCCVECDTTYRIPNIEKWKTGWRPNI